MSWSWSKTCHDSIAIFSPLVSEHRAVLQRHPALQCVTISLAGDAFARMRFPGRDLLFHAFLLQLMLVPPMLIVPNLPTLVAVHLYDIFPGVMAPYCASAFGVFLMRQTFRTIPAAHEEAALIDGASRLQIIAASYCRLHVPDWWRLRSSP
ncbi:MAG TPA: ABC transporter permease subunit [Acetobacteraceae bacterium]|nr:ABC transporter permease subunit [Acetobacteraceae bacterium]